MDLIAAKLALSLAPGVGPVAFKNIVALNPECSWKNDRGLIQLLPISEAAKNFLKTSNATVDKILQWADQPECHLICIDDARYPKLLKQIHDPPAFLYLKGRLDNLHEPQLGVVGCRDMSNYGQMLAFRFAKELAAMGITITSGLALGIDGMAHEGALQGHGHTIAVLGTGLNHIYPEAHTPLSQNIIHNGGTLVSEFAPSVGIKREHFPQRNRIISGLSLGVLVVEAAQKSGSLITAKYALEQNRPVFAIPGRVDSPQSRGCHQLLREGALLTEKIEDILHELYEPLRRWTQGVKAVTPKTQNKISLDLLENLSFNTPKSLDELALSTNKMHSTLQKELLALELTGEIKRVTGGYILV
jgi:DNA processing protein